MKRLIEIPIEEVDYLLLQKVLDINVQPFGLRQKDFEEIEFDTPLSEKRHIPEHQPGDQSWFDGLRYNFPEIYMDGEKFKKK